MSANKPGSQPGTRGRQDGKPTEGDADRTKESVLEKSLEDSFPASDPPSTGSPNSSIGWETPDEKKD
ncbi:hypothetical protein [Roseomonas marmotae]|uniref:DUF3072 domain-containing protein n=1 Tax=Roseomonas marmotae TaxID=2768161 RepID=A0ABS3K8W3_9PROT|nr:hypothetical protein [Roseomonas marmotae]MBO1073897.1 hypothetical protein [Roseomonas marmotae]QTI78485.1 hypothetical protein IAI58_12430 [Roseomonas marmotae]